jgi:hypothetical protein
MKKIFLQLTILFLLFVGFNNTSVAQSITVSGAGSAIVDGNYPLSEYTPGGKVCYIRADGYTIMWESYRWILINGPGTLRYYYNTNTTTLPPASGWQIDVDGNIPTPTMTGDVDPLPVELTSFTGIAIGNVVELAWQTATEVNNYGFEVERCTVVNRSLEVNGSLAWTKIGFVAGNGNSNSPKSYSFTDVRLNDVVGQATAKGKIVYRLKQIDNDGKFEYQGNVEVNVSSAATFALAQNFPNPFNPTTNIQYSIPNAQFVSLKVYDMLGKEIATLVNSMQEAGEKHVQFNASKLSSGVYFYTLTSGNFMATKKLLLMR